MLSISINNTSVMFQYYKELFGR